MLKDLLNCADEMLVVLIFDICNVFEIVTYEWLYLHYLGRVKMVYIAWKIGFSFCCVRLIWFCDMTKLSKSALSNFKRMT